VEIRAARAPSVTRTDVDSADEQVGTIRRDAPIGFTLDRLISPRTASRQTVSVRTGDIGLFGRVRYDVVNRRVEFRPDPGQMRAGLEYVLVVGVGLQSWDGAAIEQVQTRRFRAVDPAWGTEEPAPPPSLRQAIAPLLRARCATAGCHVPPQPVMGLDLSTADSILRTCVGVLSRERDAIGAAAPERSDPRWGAMNRIEAGIGAGGDPAYSYLIYKVLGDGPMLGARMPPEDRAPLTPDDVARVAAWILAGAPDN